MCYLDNVRKNVVSSLKQQMLMKTLTIKIKLALAGVAQWLSASLRTKRSPVQFPVRAHAVLQAGSPVEDMQDANDECISHTSMFLSLSFSLPSPPSKKKKIKLYLNSNLYRTV